MFDQEAAATQSHEIERDMQPDGDRRRNNMAWLWAGAGFVFAAFALSIVADGSLPYWEGISFVLSLLLAGGLIAFAIHVDRQHP